MRPVWLETAFVGTKPTDEPPTPEATGALLTDTLTGDAPSSTPPQSAAAAAPPPQAREERTGDQYELGELLMV